MAILIVASLSFYFAEINHNLPYVDAVYEMEWIMLG